MNEKVKNTLARWSDICFLGVFSGAIWTVFASLFAKHVETLSEGIGNQANRTFIVAVVTILIALFWHFYRFRVRALLGTRHFWSYPPWWCAVLIGIVTIEFMAEWTVATLKPMLLVPFAGVLFSIGEYIIRACRIGWNNCRKASGQPSLTHEDWEHVRAWIQSDQPLMNPSEDGFGHANIADRIATRLSDPDGGEFPTIALIGERGSGKSTILTFITHRLRELGLLHERIAIVRITLWPFESQESAVRGILDTVIAELGRRVDPLALADVSNNYVQAVAASDKRLGGMFRLLQGFESPQTTVRRIESLVVATGLRLVVFVEDAERFAGSTRTGIEGNDTLSNIRSLFFLLDGCANVSLVVADASLRSNFDPHKLARFIEMPPKMSLEAAWKYIHSVRQRCLYAEGLIDPAASESRDMFKEAQTFAELFLQGYRYDPETPELKESVVLLLRTPRVLKATLRTACETWERLAGEVDFDDVLVMSVIREAQPDVFNLIHDEIAAFRHGLKGDPDSPTHSKDHPALAKLHQILSDEEDVATRNAVETLLRSVFGDYDETKATSAGDIDRILKKPQGLAVATHVDYWKRFLSLVTVSSSESDQAALVTISAWKARGENDLLDRLFNSERAEQIVSFSLQFSQDDLCRLLNEVSDRLVHSNASEWGETIDVPGLDGVATMMSRVGGQSDVLVNAVKPLIERIAKENLPLAHQIFHSFAEDRADRKPYVDREQVAEVREALVETLKSSFDANSPESLVRALNDGQPWTLAWTCWTLSRIRENDFDGLPFEGWTEFAAVILEACRHSPNIVLPQLLMFMLDSKKRIDADGITENLVFNTDRAARLFGELDEITQMFLQNIPPAYPWSSVTEYVHSGYEAVRAATP